MQCNNETFHCLTVLDLSPNPRIFFFFPFFSFGWLGTSLQMYWLAAQLTPDWWICIGVGLELCIGIWYIHCDGGAPNVGHSGNLWCESKASDMLKKTQMWELWEFCTVTWLHTFISSNINKVVKWKYNSTAPQIGVNEEGWCGTGQKMTNWLETSF